MERGTFYALCSGLLLSFSCASVSLAQPGVQKKVLSRQDTLRGSVTPAREWWDLVFYHLDIKVDPGTRTFEGSNLVRYRVIEPSRRIQIDLQEPLIMNRVLQDGLELSFLKDGNAWFIELQKEQPAGSIQELLIFYGGRPREAVRPPWDGGVQWAKSSSGKWQIATSCQGVGASVWWPCKDHMYDEPDSMRISVNVPAGLTNVSNGRLRAVQELADGTRTFHWEVKNPINSYGVNVNIAEYERWDETFEGEKGILDLTYFVLPESREKAERQFLQVPMMLEAFEYWFGPYPFYEDGYKIVEVPYLGMEHQSSVTYGNKYANGYLGRDLSGTGWGMKFDFIIVHESGHEWFANSITYRDIAEMWIHESFTSYSESLYLEYHYGKAAAAAYLIGTRGVVRNQARIMGVFGVNQRGSGDMYYKGANMLHTIRRVIDDDVLWRKILRGLNRTFFHATVTGTDIIGYISRESGKNLSVIFKQYLEDIRLPELEYAFKNGALHYRWKKVMQGFDMPVKAVLGTDEVWLYPVADSWKQLKTARNTLVADPDFYITIKEVMP